MSTAFQVEITAADLHLINGEASTPSATLTTDPQTLAACSTAAGHQPMPCAVITRFLQLLP
jgi:hypothetical protein